MGVTSSQNHELQLREKFLSSSSDSVAVVILFSRGSSSSFTHVSPVAPAARNLQCRWRDAFTDRPSPWTDRLDWLPSRAGLDK